MTTGHPAIESKASIENRRKLHRSRSSVLSPNCGALGAHAHCCSLKIQMAEIHNCENDRACTTSSSTPTSRRTNRQGSHRWPATKKSDRFSMSTGSLPGKFRHLKYRMRVRFKLGVSARPRHMCIFKDTEEGLLLNVTACQTVLDYH